MTNLGDRVAGKDTGADPAIFGSAVCHFVIDCVDLDRASDFWSKALGAEPVPVNPKSTEVYRKLRLPNSNIDLLLQRTDDPPTAEKSRTHLDVEAIDVEAEVERLESLGATRVDHQVARGWDFWVMADPDDNEFCVLPKSKLDQRRAATFDSQQSEQKNELSKRPSKNLSRWDRLVMIVVLSTAVEVPYSFTVTNEEPDTFVYAASWLFFIVFAIDIAVSLMIRQHTDINRSEVLGVIWRRVPDRWKEKVRPQVKVYLSSWSFVIDLIATIPWVLVASGLGILPAARLARLGVIARAMKLWKAPSMWRGAFQANPALGRFVVIVASATYLWFLHACVLFWAERSNTEITFGEALNSIFITFTSNESAEPLTSVGHWVSVSAVICSVTVIAAVFGNVTSFFTNRDQLELAHIERHADWNVIFELYPTAFPPNVSDRIRHDLNEQRGSDHLEDKHVQMILSLESTLEDDVVEIILSAREPANVVALTRLRNFKRAIQRAKQASGR